MARQDTPTLGVHLLETITRGMYSEPLHCVREYIQNAYDSIRKARTEKYLSHDEGRVLLSINQSSRVLTIRDNGTGLSPEEASVYLLDIGKSEKGISGGDAIRNAGFRGIGRLAGMSYCKNLRFETSDGGGRTCIIEFDAAGINRLTKRGQEPTTIVKAIRDNSKIYELSTPESNRYLQVTLEGLEQGEVGDQFIDSEKLENYISQVAPVQFDPSVWSFSQKIRSFAERAKSASSLEHIEVAICDADWNIQTDVRRPFKNSFDTRDARGSNRRTVSVEDVIFLPRYEGAEGWWGWLARHEVAGALADMPFAGLQVRMHNIAIGDAGIIQKLFTTKPHALWCFGEIHVTDPNVTPNARRDDFEPSGQWERIRDRLSEEARRIGQEVRNESYQRSQWSAVKGAQKAVNNAKIFMEAGSSGSKAKGRIIESLISATDRAKKQVSEKHRPEEVRRTLDKLIPELEKTSKEVIDLQPATELDKALARLNRQTRRVVGQIVDLLRAELDEQTFRRIESKIIAELQPGQEP